ncbi:myosin-10 isoform X1 [Tribolium castaneum]|uniref:myosin-10 isoform X1 n=1 Tax=Tribolium castaneum TaxID=7070 RepID=UPI00077DE3FB|nr:PREDICTED: myosin-10-like isoform X1 [Tribolium castaneum]|eukprot:XP_015835665.1 PREDICTED: myosin-10-like isoform X1 [Tribolium castaneum]
MSKSNTDRDVCPVFASSGKCGEQDALDVMEQFRSFYENKLNEIDHQGGGDCLELKLKVQRRWIDDLTEQTQMMARIVKELEDEATNRVRMLEDKLRQTSKSAYEVMKRYQNYSITHNLDEPFQKVFYLENDLKNLLEFIRRIREDRKWSIDGLQFYDITYKDLFGKEQYDSNDNKERNLVPVASKDANKRKGTPSEAKADESVDENENNKCGDVFEQLKRKTIEYEALRQSMLDMRSALTEEVACKHDMISALKKDIQQLEERCVQADKQTAFKDDIIKELRKEIKQLKQQNNDNEASLRKQLDEAHQLIKRMKPCVDVTTTFTDMDNTSAARRREKDLEDEIERRQREVNELKTKCVDLEKCLASSQGCAANLQKAVDLYLNSINVLEASEERARIEIEQQKVTIANLQQALVCVKHELDELRQNNQQEISHYQYLCDVFYVNLLDLEEQKHKLEAEKNKVIESYKKLRECNFELEVEHFNALQDLAISETQLHKYQGEFRAFEEAVVCGKGEIKKLRHQIRYYEHVIDCFKHEMTAMSEQLINLQEILNLSNKSCKEENGQLHRAVIELQRLSEKLQSDLVDTEKKALVENQMNLLKDAKIDELQLVINQKNADLNMHDDAINDMKMRLENAILENHELQSTIVSLNATIMQLQCNLDCREFQKNDTGCEDRNCKKWQKLQAEYRQQYELVKNMERELHRMKDKHREKVKHLRQVNEDLKDRLATSELDNQHLHKQVKELKQTGRKDCSKEHELAQGKQIVIELRQTLIELNDTLAECDFQCALGDECHYTAPRGVDKCDCYTGCRDEISLFKKLAENLKDKLVEMRKKLSDAELRNKSLSEELKNKDVRLNDLQKRAEMHVSELKRQVAELEARNKILNDELKSKDVRVGEVQKRAAKKEKEHCQCIQELTEKLKDSQEEERRLSEFIDNLKREVQKKIDDKKAVANFCECNEISETQEEISTLKVEIKSMISNQLALNSENDKLLKQVTSLQNTIVSLEEKNRQLKQKLDKLHAETKNLKEKNKSLTREKETCAQTIRNLELELNDAKNNRDDLCTESRCVVNNVKAWLEEQRKINDRVKKKTQCYCETIAKLKQENESLNTGRNYCTPCNKTKNERGCRPCSPPVDWFMGSQGSSNSPPESPPDSCACSIEEWYSPNFRDEETDDQCEEFINSLEAVTQEIRENNKKWNCKAMSKICGGRNKK